MAIRRDIISERSKYWPGASVLGIVMVTGVRESADTCERKQCKEVIVLTEGCLGPGITVGLEAELGNLEPLGVRRVVCGAGTLTRGYVVHHRSCAMRPP
jgi:hypothetical protein